MSTFDNLPDTPNTIKTEGEKITLKWLPGLDANGNAVDEMGLLQWNLPSPARGCSSISEGISAYSGIVLIARLNQPVDATNIPQDGVKYKIPDNTVDPDLHTGDRIGDALVIGAFYENQQKARGEEMTTFLEVFNVDPNTNYFFAAYAVNDQRIYHSDGVRAYSSKKEKTGTGDTTSYQIIELGSGVNTTNSTNLDPTTTYQFDLFVNDSTIHFDIPGHGDSSPLTSITYGELVNEINHQIALSLTNIESTNPPNTGLYYCSNNIVYQWDGNQHTQVDNVIYEATDPPDVGSPSMGYYWWYNPETELLKQWSSTPPEWTDVSFISHSTDPQQLESCADYWYNGTSVYKFITPTWCEQIAYIQTDDPAEPIDLGCYAYWFSTIEDVLYHYNEETQGYTAVYAVQWPEAPNQLSLGTYWFDLTNQTLFQLENSPANWNELDVTIACEQPDPPVSVGTYWYNPDTEILYQWTDSVSPAPHWAVLEVLVWPTDPSDVESCDLWWNDDILYQWDSSNNTWYQVENFYIQETDPRLPPEIDEDSVWLNLDTNQMFVSKNQIWVEVEFLEGSTDPRTPESGTIWYDYDDNKWYMWNSSPEQWDEFQPIDSTIDPFSLPLYSLWFNTSSQELYQLLYQSGLTWVEISYSSTGYQPTYHSLWYDTSNDLLMEWSGTEWVAYEDVPVIATLNDDGHLKFETTMTGSNAVVLVVVPSDVPYEMAAKTGYGCGCSYTCISSHSFALYDRVDCCECLPTTSVTANTFLFSNISIAKILPQYHGYDEVSTVPSYLELGVGDDGTPDERRELISNIRIQLGYPSIEVELTHEQLDLAVRKSLDKFRQVSSAAYKVGHFFLDINPGQQHYILSNKRMGYNKIVTVMAAYRFTSAFLSTAHGAGVYGQIILQHLYNMGTYDLTSYFLISQYVEQLEHLFATRLVFNWVEHDRRLSFYQSFVRQERVLLETTIEKTEQEILVDRWAKNWIERWAVSEARIILAEIRGKYGSLPGAGGGLSLNASDLKSAADTEQEKLLSEIDDFIANMPDDIGMHSTVIVG